jgi:uncharacterized integral membrane protein
MGTVHARCPEYDAREEEGTVNRGSLIGGIICLVLAILLAILNWRLPADEVVFMIGDVNAPLVPVAILAVVGLALIIGAFVRPRGRRGR